jgi:hypothetical protein
MHMLFVPFACAVQHWAADGLHRMLLVPVLTAAVGGVCVPWWPAGLIEEVFDLELPKPQHM